MKQQKISSMLTRQRKKKEKENSTHENDEEENPTEQVKEGPKPTESSASEDEDDWPITFSQFLEYTNIDVLIMKLFKKSKPQRYEKMMKSMNQDDLDCILKSKKKFYTQFYMQPERRERTDLRLLRAKPDAPASVREHIFDVPKKYQHRLTKKKKSVQSIVLDEDADADAPKQSSMSVNTEMWENDIRDPQPSTSKRATQFMSKSCTEEARKRLAVSLLNERRAYIAEAENDMPVSYAKFKRIGKFDWVIDSIIDVAIDGDRYMFEKLNADLTLRERVILNYYYAYYNSPDETRRHFPLALKPCPSHVKNEIEQKKSSRASKRVHIISVEKLNAAATSSTMDVNKETIQAAAVDGHMETENVAKKKQINEILQETPIITDGDKLEISTLKEISPPLLNDSCQINTKKARFISDEEINQDIDEIMLDIHQSQNDANLNHLDSNKRAATSSPTGYHPKRTKLHNLSKADVAKEGDNAEDVSNLDLSEELMVNINNSVEFPLRKFTAVVADTFSKPVENLAEIEETLPISFERFKSNIDTASVLNLLCKTIANGNQRLFENMREDAEMCNTLLSNFYKLLFINQYMALFFPMQETKSAEVTKNDSQKLIVTPSCEASSESTQNDEVIENESEIFFFKDGTGTHGSKGTQIEGNNEEQVTSTKVRNFDELSSTQYSKDFLTQYIKSKVLPECEAKVLQKIENFVAPENTPSSPPPTNAEPNQTVQKEEISKSRSPEEVYFEQWHERHSLHYMFSNSVGEKRRVWSNILGMTFKEFKKYTQIIQGNHIYQDTVLISRCYSETILERNAWPINLYITLDNLINYLKHKDPKLLDNLTLEHISPKVIKYLDLFQFTNFYECTAEHFKKRVEDFVHEEMLSKAKDFYRSCWLTNSWGQRVPKITNEDLLTKIAAIANTPSSHAPQSPHTLIKKVAQKSTETKPSTPQKTAAEKPKSPVSNVRNTTKKDNTENNRKSKLINAATKEKLKSQSPVKANVSAQLFTAIPNSGSSEENVSFEGITKVNPSPNLFSSSGSVQLSDKTVLSTVENVIATASQPLSEPCLSNSQVLAENCYYFVNTAARQLNTSTQAASAEDPLDTQTLFNLLDTEPADNKREEPDLLPVEEIKVEKQMPDKMIITLSDNGTVINVERVHEEVINIDEDDSDIKNLLTMSKSSEEVESSLSIQSSEEHCSIRQTQPFFEQSQATQSKNTLDSSNVTIRKKNDKNTAKNKKNVNEDLGAQLTHVFRSLPVQPVVRRNVFQTDNGELHKPANQSNTYSMSQDLSLFNSSQLLKAALEGTDINPEAKTTSKIPVRAEVNSKQVNNKQPRAAKTTTNTNQLLLYHKIKKFDYFAKLTIVQVVDFKLSVIARGQAYMRALICTGDAKFWLQGDNLASIFSYFGQDILMSIRNLLQEFDEFHYDERENATIRRIDDAVQNISHRALFHLFSTAIPISACQLQLSNMLGGYNRSLVRIKRFSGVPAAKLNIEKVFSAEFMETVKKRLDQSVIIID